MLKRVGRVVDALLRRATRTGMRRGLGGDHWAWLVIACSAYLLQRARRPNERVERINLQQGERCLVALQSAEGRRRPTTG